MLSKRQKIRFYVISDGLIRLYLASCCLIQALQDGFKKERYCCVRCVLRYGDPHYMPIPSHLLASSAEGGTVTVYRAVVKITM